MYDTIWKLTICTFTICKKLRNDLGQQHPLFIRPCHKFSVVEICCKDMAVRYTPASILLPSLSRNPSMCTSTAHEGRLGRQKLLMTELNSGWPGLGLPEVSIPTEKERAWMPAAPEWSSNTHPLYNLPPPSTNSNTHSNQSTQVSVCSSIGNTTPFKQCVSLLSTEVKKKNLGLKISKLLWSFILRIIIQQSLNYTF